MRVTGNETFEIRASALQVVGELQAGDLCAGGPVRVLPFQYRVPEPSAREYEMVYDADRPADVFIRLAVDGALTPIVRRSYQNDGRNGLIDKGTMPRRARPSGHFPPAGRPAEVRRVGDDE